MGLQPPPAATRSSPQRAPFTQDSETGTWVGVDEDFGMRLRGGDATRLIPLTTVLETPR